MALVWGVSRDAFAQGGIVIDCPLPAAGTQTTHSQVTAFFDVFTDVSLEGDVSIRQGDVNSDGIMPIEIVAMDLTGNSAAVGPIHLRESPTKASLGRASQIHCEPGPDGTLQAYAMAFFDVFVEIDLPEQNNLTLTNPTPVHMVTLKPVPLDHRIPGVVLTQQNQQVPFIDAAGRTRGTLSNTVHELTPPTDVPSPCFPRAGKDVMDSTLLHDIDIVGIGLCRANLAGPVVVERSDPYIDPATGLTCIDTKMVDLNLTGVDPVCGRMAITLNPYKTSKGIICEKVKGTCFPANSCFEVFVRVELLDLGLCLYACEPAKMCCMISQIPPFGCLYNLDIGAGSGPIPLYRGPCAAPAGGDPCAVTPLPPPVAYIIKAVHQPEPPKQCACYPRAGEDVMNTTLIHQIVFPGLNLSCSKFTGPMVVRRSDPFINDAGLCCIKTEIIHMEMKGDCGNGVTAVIRLCPDMPSTGLICEKERGTCFPANSCFNIFFEVELTFATGGTAKFKNCDPAIMCCMIDRLPPIGCPYQIQNAPISIYRVPATGGSPCKQTVPPVPDGILQNANHTPDNEPKSCCPEYGPGTDIMQSQLLHDIDIPGIGRCAANLSGPVTVKRGVPYQDPLTGLCCVETEMVALDLQGADPVCGRICINLDPRRPSRGRICSKQPTACFPATSCFEVFVRVQLKDLGITLVSCQPAKMCCMIDAIPPFGCLYQLDIGNGDVVPLYEESTAGTGGGGGVPTSCLVSDDGTGTVSLPPVGCQYLSPDQVHMIVDGLPAGTTIELGAIHKDFICRKNGAAAGGGGGVPGFHCGTPGGSLGGEQETFLSTLDFDMNGTGSLSTFHRMVSIPNVLCMTSTGPRTPGDPVQSFPTQMEQLQGQLPPGDPDFDLLRVTAGNAFGMPSPGHTTLTRMAGGSWAVDSFFDITYRIDFVGSPGGKLGGRSGSTTGTIRMQAGSGGGVSSGSPCDQVPPPNPRAFIVKAVHQPNPPCECFPPAGEDIMQSELSHRIRLFGLGPNGGDLICDADMNGPVVVKRSAPYVDPATGLCCIDTEMIRLDLTGVDPVCGPVMVHLAADTPTKGKICQKPTNPPGQCFPANSFFDVFIEVEIPSLGVRLRNCAPTRMECMIDAIPPINCVYELNLTSVPLYRPGECQQLPNPNIRPTGQIEAAQHVPRVPCDCPYGPGVDVMDSTLSHDIFLFGFGKLCAEALHGVVEVERGMTYKTADGLCCVSTRMRKLELTGIDPTCGPIKISLSPDRPSRGRICQMMPGACFPAQSCFEVFIQVEVMDMVLVNCQPAVMCCKIDSLPPFGCTYQINLGANVPLFKRGDCGPNATAIGEIRQAVHVPKPCGPVGIRCDVQADGSVVVTPIDDPNCPCEGRIVITRSIDGGPVEVVSTTGGNSTSITDKPCANLPAGVVHTVKYCAQCVRSDGVASEVVCCEVRCGQPPPPDCIESITCARDGGKVVIKIVTKPGCPCDRVVVSLNGRPIGTVPVPTTGTIFFPCAPGEYCVQCVDAAGVLGPQHCCKLDSCEEPHGGLQIPGDCNQDGVYDISDAICKFGYLFLGKPEVLPCGAGGNKLVDVNGDGNVDLSDGVWDLNFLFSTGRPPVLGTNCQPIEGCTDVCSQ